MFRLFVLLSWVLFSTCSGPTVFKCKPETCSGCCAASGECIAPSKQTNASCGNQGATCRLCLSTQSCANARCVNLADAGISENTGGGDAMGSGGGANGFGGGAAGGGAAGGTAACGDRNQICCVPGVCLFGLSCDRGVCDPGVPDAGPSTLKATGEPCQLSTECDDGLCLSVGFSNGYCTKACSTTAQCSARTACGKNPSGNGPAKICLKQCTAPYQSPGGCRTDYVCEPNAETANVPVCFPKCTSNTSCGSAPTCDSRGFCCGAQSSACCENTSCQGANTCTNGACIPTACGGAGQPCCNGSCSGAATACVNNTCAACGGSGQPCCAGNACASVNTICSAGTCSPCGALSRNCCAGNTCSTGSCVAGVCQNAGLLPVGEPCTAGNQCAGNTCITATATTFLGGYCTQDCGSSSCPSGSHCSNAVVAARSFCLKDCVYDGAAGGCRSNYVCDRGLIPVDRTLPTCVSACVLQSNCPLNTQCLNGFCCGKVGFKCCAGNTCPSSGTCGALGYCQ
jgi:hypothetical protein